MRSSHLDTKTGSGSLTPLASSRWLASAGVELADVLAAQSLHQLADGAGSRGRGQQVHVVVHQHVGVQLALAGEQGFTQQLQIAGAVGVVEETGQAVVAALHDVLRDARQVDAGLAGHAGRIGTAAPSGYQGTFATLVSGRLVLG